MRSTTVRGSLTGPAGGDLTAATGDEHPDSARLRHRPAVPAPGAGVGGGAAGRPARAGAVGLARPQLPTWCATSRGWRWARSSTPRGPVTLATTHLSFLPAGTSSSSAARCARCARHAAGADGGPNMSPVTARRASGLVPVGPDRRSGRAPGAQIDHVCWPARSRWRGVTGRTVPTVSPTTWRWWSTSPAGVEPAATPAAPGCRPPWRSPARGCGTARRGRRRSSSRSGRTPPGW